MHNLYVHGLHIMFLAASTVNGQLAMIKLLQAVVLKALKAGDVQHSQKDLDATKNVKTMTTGRGLSRWVVAFEQILKIPIMLRAEFHPYPGLESGDD